MTAKLVPNDNNWAWHFKQEYPLYIERKYMINGSDTAIEGPRDIVIKILQWEPGLVSNERGSAQEFRRALIKSCLCNDIGTVFGHEVTTLRRAYDKLKENGFARLENVCPVWNRSLQAFHARNDEFCEKTLSFEELKAL